MEKEYVSFLQESIIRFAHDARRDSIAQRRYKDLSRAAAAWTTQSLIGDAKGTALSIVLATIGCSHARGDSGGCTMCSYLLDGTEKVPTNEQLVTQFEGAMKKVETATAPLSVKLYTSGSFLDVEEVELEVRGAILDSIAQDERVTEVVIESRPEYVTKEVMRELRNTLGTRHIEIGIGLESSTDAVRTLCINKGFTREDFEEATAIAQSQNIGIRAYVLLKPPFLSENDGLQDALHTIKYCGDIGVSTVSVNPINVQKYTLVERLWKGGEYRPPWLWSLVELLRASRNNLDTTINIVCDPVAAGKRRGVHNCGKCDKKIVNAIREFSLSQDVRLFENLSCGCQKTWMHVLEHEEIAALVHGDY